MCCFLALVVVGIATGNPYVTNALSFVTTPLQELGASMSESIKKVLPVSKTDEDYQNIIDSQREELQKMRAATIDYENIKRENSQYEKYYDLKKHNESLKSIPASVIGRDPDENFYGFSIDRGSIAGVSVDDPVITANGLVGWIDSVRPMSSVIKTILSPDSKVGAICKETNESGVITGSIKFSDRNLTKMMFLPPCTLR